MYGVQGGGILPPILQEQACNALEAIKPFGVPLARVVADWIERQQEEKKSLRVEEAKGHFIASRQRSPSYHASLRQTRNKVKSFIGTKALFDQNPAASASLRIPFTANFATSHPSRAISSPQESTPIVISCMNGPSTTWDRVLMTR